MKLALPFAILLLLLGACVAPVYYCETEFGQDPPLENEAGAMYWPGLCYPQDQYNLGVEDPDGNPGY